ncbi:hypothetical protein HPB51_001594 [Rhipicephalus microplus]|uniref:Calcineurin-like phosphoesterase domain-containing protein n=1 Tax=Rhipicephalus microplus TaxID=6941 RepID=A0A9J6ER84_RHIMP|nr:hypothetical protein HPB51_001594 [Rhipicephalus microplus]
MCLARPQQKQIGLSSAIRHSDGFLVRIEYGRRCLMSTEAIDGPVLSRVGAVDRIPRLANSWRTTAWSKATAGVEASGNVGLLAAGFSPVPGVKLISLDCFEESVLGRDPFEPRWQQAAELLTRVHGTSDPPSWEWPDALSGLDKRFIDSNGALSEAQLQWLDAELAQSDAAGDVVIVFGHLAISPESANADCLLWNYRDVMDLFEAHSCVALYLCGHTHRCGYSTDASGTHYMALAGIIETEPESVAFSTVSVFRDRIEVVGSGREESRTLPIRSSEPVAEEDVEEELSAAPAVSSPLTVRVAV